MARKPLKMLIVTSDEYPFFRVDLTVLFGKEFAAKGHEIDWLVQAERVAPAAYQQWAGGNAFVAKRIAPKGLVSKLCNHLFSLVNDFRALLLPRKTKYDVLQVKDKFFVALFVILASRLYGIPFVYWLSYPFPEAWIYEGKKKLVWMPKLRVVRGYIAKFLLYKVISPCATYMFVQSQQMKMDIAKEGVPTDKMTVVPMGIDLEQCKRLDTTAGERKKDLVYMGIFYKVRKLEFLLRMFAKVLQEEPDARLLFIGKGENREVEEDLKREAGRLGIESQVFFTGYLPLDEALALVQKASVAVSSYHPTFVLNSTSPTKVIEYMAMGKAVVGNSHPEQKVLIEESGGGLCVPYDEQAFAEAVVRLLKDPELAEEMGRRGAEYVAEKRAYSIIAEDLENTYYAILEK